MSENILLRNLCTYKKINLYCIYSSKVYKETILELIMPYQIKITGLIVEDQIENADYLKLIINKYCKEIDLIGVAGTSSEFMEMYLEHLPDIIFLDVELGETETSFETLEKIRKNNSVIIVVSAHDDFALKAINEFGISGYLIKPVRIEELVNVVSVAIEQVEQKRKSKNLPYENTQVINSGLITLASTDSVEFLKVEDIIYLEADGKYTVFHLTNNSKKVSSKNIGEYEKQLLPHFFFRIHYKYIVNLEKVISINKRDGNYCELITKKYLPIAKRRYQSLIRLLS